MLKMRYIDALTSETKTGGIMDGTTGALAGAGASAFNIKAIFWFLVSKIGALCVGFVAASALVISLTHTNSKKEQFLAVFSTGIFSITGGSAFIDYFHLTQFGTAATLGVGIVVGLPGWFLVRGAFTYFNRNQNKGIDETIAEAKKESLIP